MTPRPCEVRLPASVVLPHAHQCRCGVRWACFCDTLAACRGPLCARCWAEREGVQGDGVKHTPPPSEMSPAVHPVGEHKPLIAQQEIH